MSIEQIHVVRADLIFLSSEPFPFVEQHGQEIAQLFSETAVHLVDGETFSWYDSRLVTAVAYFRDLIHSLEG